MKNIILLFFLFFGFQVFSQNEEKQVLINETRRIKLYSGELVLDLIDRAFDYDEAYATLTKDGPGRFGINIGIEYYKKGQLVRTVHATRYQNGNYGLKTKATSDSTWDHYYTGRIKDLPSVIDTLENQYFQDLKDK